MSEIRRVKRVTVFLEGETGGMVYNNPDEVRPGTHWLTVRLGDRANVFNRKWTRCFVIEYGPRRKNDTSAAQETS